MQMAKFENETEIEKWRALRDAGKKRQAEQALGALIAKNDGLVYKVVRRELKGRASNPDNLEEAAQEGRIGLLRAIQDFDTSKGGFTTYACFWIRHHVQTCMQKQGDFERHRAGRMPREIAKACNKIRLLTGREPTHEDVGVTREAWDGWLGRTFVMSLQEPQGEAGGDYLEDILADTRENAEDVATNTQLRRRIEEAMTTMSPRNRDLTKALFIDGDTVEECATKFNVCEQRISQIRPILDGKLRKAVRLQGRKAS